MRRALIIITLFCFLFANILPIRTNAGALKLIYEMGDTTTKAVLSTVKARKGLRSVPETGSNWNDRGEIFIDAMSFGLQEMAMDSWNTVNGKKFDSTPLKGMPGWLKVTLGTAAFITSADIALDIYNAVQNGEEVDVLTNEIKGAKYTSYNGFKVWYEVSGPRSDPGSEHLKYKQIKTYHVAPFDYKFETTKIYKANEVYVDEQKHYEDDWGKEFAPFITVTDDGRLFMNYYLARFISSPEIRPIGNVDPTPVNVVRKKLNPNHYQSVPVPEIDPNKQTQTLIVPDPNFFPDIDKAINENWDMVSNPEEWLRKNPQHDPSPNPEIPNVPDPGDGKDPSKLPGADPIPEQTPPEAEPPSNGDACERPWDLKSFKTLGNSMSTKFPFSIPWDVYRAFYAVFGGMQESDGQWQFVLGASTDKPTTIDIKIPEFFDGWRKFINTVLLITFDIGLVYAIRKWLGGAS